MTFNASFNLSLSLSKLVQPALASVGFSLPALASLNVATGFGSIAGSVSTASPVDVYPGAIYTVPTGESLQLKDLRLLMLQATDDAESSINFTDGPLITLLFPAGTYTFSRYSVRLWYFPSGVPLTTFDDLQIQGVNYLFIGAVA